MPHITEYSQTEIENFCKSDLQTPLAESFANQKNLVRVGGNEWVQKHKPKVILAEFLHQNFLLGMGGIRWEANGLYMHLQTGYGFCAEINDLEKVDAVYNYFKRFLSTQKRGCYDKLIAMASAHLDLFNRINKVEDAVKTHKDWLDSITRDLEVTGLSKQLRKLENVNKIKNAPEKVAELRWAWGDIIAKHTSLFEWNEDVITELEVGGLSADKTIINNKFALRRMTEHKKQKHLFGD
jgi:hypothetical protein